MQQIMQQQSVLMEGRSGMRMLVVGC